MVDLFDWWLFFVGGLWAGWPANGSAQRRKQANQSKKASNEAEGRKGSAAAAGKNEMEFNLLNEMEFFRNSSQQAAHQAAHGCAASQKLNQPFFSSQKKKGGCVCGVDCFFFRN